jgi:hypothetical protein
VHQVCQYSPAVGEDAHVLRQGATVDGGVKAVGMIVLGGARQELCARDVVIETFEEIFRRDRVVAPQRAWVGWGAIVVGETFLKE